MAVENVVAGRTQRRKRLRKIRTLLKSFWYFDTGLLFVKSRRGAKLAVQRGVIVAADSSSRRTQVDFFVTLGWLVRSVWSKDLPLRSFLIPRPYGRLGNQIVQLAHAVAFSDRNRISRILAPGNLVLSIFPPAKATDLDLDDSRKRIVRPTLPGFTGFLTSLRHSEVHVVGNPFFERPILGEKISPEERTRAYVKLRTQLSGLSIGPSLSRENLVIHLRGGDVFKKNPHREYGQPPLCFYVKILEEFNWSGVTIVHQDNQNPVLKPLLARIKRMGVSLHVQSSSLEEDVGLILRAHSVASSRGTFIPAITGLSSSIQKVFLFGVGQQFREDLEKVTVLDRSGGYWSRVCDANWANTEEQRNLMVSYPSSRLTFAGSDDPASQPSTM